MALTNKERQRRWMEKNRAAFNLRRRNARRENSGLGKQESKVQTDVPRIEMPLPEIPFKTKKVGEFRMIVLPEEKPSTEAPVVEDGRAVSDVARGIYRNDNGGVISKFAWEKLQRLKEHAKANNFEIDDYSQ